MPIQVYSGDFREKDGEAMSSSDIKANFQGIQDAANSLDWMNVDDGSLDQFHVKIGEPLKGAGGRFAKGGTVVGGYQSWTTLVSVFPKVQEGSAVYAFGNVTFDRLNTVGTVRANKHPTASDQRPSSLKTEIRISAPYTERVHPHAHCPAVYGQAGLVHAYRVTSQMLSNPAAGGAQHNITFDLKCVGGPHPYAAGMTDAANLFAGSGYDYYQSYWDEQERMGVMANFVVFVIDR